MKHIAVEKLQDIYIKIAYNEIFKHIIDNPDMRPIDAIDDFIFWTAYGATEAKTSEQSFMFSVIADTAQYVSDSLRLKTSGELLDYYEKRTKIAEAVELIDELKKEDEELKRSDICG